MCLGHLFTLEANNIDEEPRVAGAAQKLAREKSDNMYPPARLPVLVEGDDGVLLARTGVIHADPDEHVRSPRCRFSAA
jgi:hypothetical protein